METAKVLGGRHPDGGEIVRTLASPIHGREFVLEEGQTYSPPHVEEISHETMESWVQTSHECRQSGGITLKCDSPKELTLGFVHHPEKGPSTHHRIRLRDIKAKPLSEEVAALIGMSTTSFREALEGKRCPVTGEDLRHHFSPEDLEALGEAMMHSELLECAYSPSGRIEALPRDTPQGIEKRAEEFRVRQEALGLWIERSEGKIPEGWGRFVLPYDCAGFGVEGDHILNICGAFVRRGAHTLFRVFEDGTWDELQLACSWRKVNSGKQADFDAAVAVVGGLSSTTRPPPSYKVEDVPLTG
jgi:hypothetical protein